MSESSPPPSDQIRSVSRALRVIEAVGQSPRGLTVKQLARRCGCTPATAYHVVRTFTYERYLSRREDGTYTLGLQVARRYRELAGQLAMPAPAVELTRRSAARTGHTHVLAQAIDDRIAVTVVAHGAKTPPIEAVVAGSHHPARSTAWGLALLSAMTTAQRFNHCSPPGVRADREQVLAELDHVDSDLRRMRRSGLFVEYGSLGFGVASGAVLAPVARPHPSVAVAALLPTDDLRREPATVRTQLRSAAAQIAHALTSSR